VQSLRESVDATLREVPVLIRPHPKRAYEFDGLNLEQLPNVAVWPRGGEVPISDQAKDVYFDSIFHSSAVVGLNTSAMIEAGIIGRPVYTVLLPEFYDNQEGTLHFRHLLEAGGGLLHASRSLDEHFAQLRTALVTAPAASANDAFVEAFVRPHGLARPATPIFADAIERLPALRRAPSSSPVWARCIRAGLWPLAWMLCETGNTEQIWRTTRRSERTAAQDAQRAMRKAAQDAQSSIRKTEQAERMAAHRARKRAADQRRKRILRWRTDLRTRWQSFFFRAS
jgi:hypothetical protein